jgi:dTDP-4-amino-4,6-dideoxygalactose transaminase
MKKIFVTKPSLPPLEEFIPHLREIWGSGVLTNSGPYHEKFELALSEYLGVKHVSLFSNATIGLIVALQALRITGEVITTPYSFVATAHSLLWNGVKPVFVDINEDDFCLDVDKIEAAITPQTTAIMPVHAYGYPCDTARLERLAETYNLKIIYDAAHAFGVSCDCGSLFDHGDLSVLSFHATKVFNTFEGGAVIARNARMKQRIDRLKNFGFVDETTVVAPGINGKMNEFQSALGLLQLQHVDGSIAERAHIDALYREALRNVHGIQVPALPRSLRHNYSYFPILVKPNFPLSRDALYQVLREQGYFARRYFFPLISDFPMYRGLPSAAPDGLPVASRVAREVICLPIYPGLGAEDVRMIAQAIASAAK